MAKYSENIRSRADVMRFFIHLHEDLHLNFHPDNRFEDYVDYESGKASLSPEQCVAYEQVMEDCHSWCENNGEDIYQIALESGQFSEFLAGHQIINDQEEIKKFFEKYLDENYGVEGIIALHT
jgi:hypothetical protein